MFPDKFKEKLQSLVVLAWTSFKLFNFFSKAAPVWIDRVKHVNYLFRKILRKNLLRNGSQTSDTCSSLHRYLRSGKVMTYMESEIIIKEVDVKCPTINQR